MISIVVALDKNRGIGLKNGLPWTLPADLRHFKEVTMGHPIIMGRKTHESIGRALPGRKNIIITRNEGYVAEGCEVVHSLEEAIALAGAGEVCIIGGGEIFVMALPMAQKLYVTEVDHVFSADVYFPEINPDEWKVVSRDSHKADEKNPHDYAFVVYERR